MEMHALRPGQSCPERRSRIGVSFGSSGFMVNASASGSRGKGDGSDSDVTNTHVNASIDRPHMTLSDTVKKYSKSYSGDELWRQIINASQRSNSQVNQSLNVSPLNPKR